MKARVRIEMPPGTEGNLHARARVVEGIAKQLGVSVNDAHEGCEHGELSKSERKELPKLRHRMPQTLIDRSVSLYEKLTARMLEEVTAVLLGE